MNSGETYSIVISNLGHYLQPDAIQNRIYTLDKEGNPMTSSAGFPFATYATANHFTGEQGIFATPTLAFATPRNIYEQLADGPKDVTNILKTFVNGSPCAFFWHHGGVDDSCKFHGLHIHPVVKSPTKLAQVNQYRVLKKVVGKYGLEVSCQKVQHLEGLLNHLQQEPRVLLGCNNLSLCARLKKTCAKNPFYVVLDKPCFDKDECDPVAQKADDAGNFVLDLLKFKKQAPVPAMTSVIDKLSKATDTIDTMSEPIQSQVYEQKQLKETHTAKKVELVKGLMKKYNKTNEEELLKEIIKPEDLQDLVNYRVLFTGPYIRTIQAQAISELRIENNLMGYTYIDKFIEECPSPVDVMGVEETAQLHLDWCSDQGIDTGDFMVKLNCVLSKSYAKVNCFMLQGQSNASKTYWTLPVMCFPDIVGQTIQSQDFAYYRCLSKEIIQIPELSLSKPEKVEESKKIFEGLPTTVNVKNKVPRVLERTPVILTCNNHPWKFFNEGMPAFLNRMFAFQNLQKSPMLDERKGPNPKYYRRDFEFIKKEVATMPEFPCMPSDEPMWKTYCEMVASFIQSLIVMKDIDLVHVMDSPTMH